MGDWEMGQIVAGLTQVDGNVYIHANTAITDLRWLSNVAIGGCLWVMENVAVTNYGT